MTDCTEESLGICAYLSSHEGFTGVLKGRFSDFVVHEGELGCDADHLCSVVANGVSNLLWQSEWREISLV